jgi:hypothetical protein
VTIEKGSDWGRIVPRPADLRFVDGDAALAAALRDGTGTPTAPRSGDLHRTVGGRRIEDLDHVLELPIDLMRVLVDDVEVVGCAHVEARRPMPRGGWWRGDVVMVMNAEFLRGWQIAARGHPNDGRLESCAWGREFGLRQRMQARRLLPTGAHVPHPQIETRSFRSRTWDFDRPLVVSVDGTVVTRARRLDVEVLPDAAVIYA